MPVIAIIGAGPGMGLSIARRFGAEGFQVALVFRTKEKVEALAAQLVADGVEAAAFAADVMRPDTVRSALAAAADRFGPIDVLEYSPADRGLAGVSAAEAPAEDLQPQFSTGGSCAWGVSGAGSPRKGRHRWPPQLVPRPNPFPPDDNPPSCSTGEG
jgi:NAD(P)-dependent dehydrogenase (short-subunit alcohol dehydrogenase family)